MTLDAKKTCTYVVDYDEEAGHELTCGEPVETWCNDECYCHQHAHDWLDELEPGRWHEVAVAVPLVKP